MASGLDALGSLWGPPSPSTPVEAVPDPPGGPVSCEALGSRVRPGTAPVTTHFPEALSALENPLCPPRSAPRPHPVILSEVVDQARRGWREQMAGTGQAGSGAGGRRSVCLGPGAVVSQARRSSRMAPTRHHLPNCGLRVARSFSFPGEARSHLCAKQSRVSRIRLSPTGQTEPMGLGLGCEPDRSARGWLRLPNDRPLHLADRAPCCLGCGRPACLLFFAAPQALREPTLFLPGWLCPDAALCSAALLPNRAVPLPRTPPRVCRGLAIRQPPPGVRVGECVCACSARSRMHVPGRFCLCSVF